jgi:hypothetical protein
MINKTFTNELGNKVRIKIETKRDAGVVDKTKERVEFVGVKISMIGPSSMLENYITLKEAYELYESLEQYLNKL